MRSISHARNGRTDAKSQMCKCVRAMGVRLCRKLFQTIAHINMSRSPNNCLHFTITFIAYTIWVLIFSSSFSLRRSAMHSFGGRRPLRWHVHMLDMHLSGQEVLSLVNFSIYSCLRFASHVSGVPCDRVELAVELSCAVSQQTWGFGCISCRAFATTTNIQCIKRNLQFSVLLVVAQQQKPYFLCKTSHSSYSFYDFLLFLFFFRRIFSRRFFCIFCCVSVRNIAVRVYLVLAINLGKFLPTGIAVHNDSH